MFQYCQPLIQRLQDTSSSQEASGFLPYTVLRSSREVDVHLREIPKMQIDPPLPEITITHDGKEEDGAPGPLVG